MAGPLAGNIVVVPRVAGGVVALYTSTLRQSQLRSSKVAVNKAFGLSSRSVARISCEVFNVQFTLPENRNHYLQVDEDTTLLEALKEEDPTFTSFGCQKGHCGLCTSSIKVGDVEDVKQCGTALTTIEMENGKFVLICSAYAKSHGLVIETDKVEKLMREW